ncbi:MAG: hypothetical protein HOH74_32185 [Gemmatimonadetes bacterium]|jgi:hypothetical protein|nr:hypothetical protein [Gemmatimonadota bacterium]
MIGLLLITLFLWPLRVAADSALDLADHLYGRGQYDAATTEYKRFVFFHPEDGNTAHAYYRMALALRQDHLWPEAIAGFQAAIERLAHQPLRNEMRLDLAVTLIAAAEYESALHELSEIGRTTTDARLLQRAQYFQGVAQLYRYNWFAARQALAQHYGMAQTKAEIKQGRRIETLLRQGEKLSLKSERKARLYATFVPGLGQVYGGAWKSGINALMVNGLTTFAVLHSLSAGAYVDAGLLFGLVFNRYYFGNRYHAALIARQHNERQARKHAGLVMHVLLPERRGLGQ